MSHGLGGGCGRGHFVSGKIIWQWCIFTSTASRNFLVLILHFCGSTLSAKNYNSHSVKAISSHTQGMELKIAVWRLSDYRDLD